MKIRTKRGYIVTNLSNVTIEFKESTPYSPVNQHHFLIIQGLEYEIEEDVFDELEKALMGTPPMKSFTY